MGWKEERQTWARELRKPHLAMNAQAHREPTRRRRAPTDPGPPAPAHLSPHNELGESRTERRISAIMIGGIDKVALRCISGDDLDRPDRTS